MLKTALTTIKKSAKAFGLVEVIVALAIISILSMGALNTASSALRLVRSYELRDTASGILLRSLEVASTPIDIKLREQVPAGTTGSFQLNYSTNIGDSFVEFERVGGGGGQAIDQVPSPSCEAGNAYAIEIDTGYLICNEVIIRSLGVEDVSDVSNLKQYNFEITSIVVYEFNNEVYTDRLVNFRTEFADN